MMYWPLAKEISFKGVSIFSSGGHVVQNILINFGRGYLKEHFCEIILNWDQRFRRCCFKIFPI